MEDGRNVETSAPDSGVENAGGNDTVDSVVDSPADTVIESSEAAPLDSAEGEESVPESSESSSGAPETEVVSGTVDADEEAPQETVTESVVESETETVTETETELETETETGSDIEDILHDIQNTLSGNTVDGGSGFVGVDGAVSGNSTPDTVSGNDYVSVDYTGQLQGLQDSLGDLRMTVTCIFIVICLFFVRQAAKHIAIGLGGKWLNG
ncbi:hypothetical protein [Eisenbergiella sp.]